MEFDREIFVKSNLMGNGLFLPQCYGEQILLVVWQMVHNWIKQGQSVHNGKEIELYEERAKRKIWRESVREKNEEGGKRD